MIDRNGLIKLKMIDMVGFIWSNLSYWYYCYDRYDGNGLIKFKRLKWLIWLKWCFSLEDKLRWMFSLYDINKDGVLSPTEIRFVKLPIICIKCRKRVCRIFSLYMYYFTNRNKICRIFFQQCIILPTEVQFVELSFYWCIILTTKIRFVEFSFFGCSDPLPQ